MSLGYNDLNDLIQNQRALAELVHGIKEHYDEMKSDIEYVREVDQKIQQLNADMTETMDRFSESMSELDGRMKDELAKLKVEAQKVKDMLTVLVNDADGNPRHLETLINEVAHLIDLVARGVLKPDGTYTGGMEDLDNRLIELEKRSPAIVIYEDGEENDIPVSDRVSGVLYGRKTNKVTDIQSGQAIKISPYLQGVVVGDE